MGRKWLKVSGIVAEKFELWGFWIWVSGKGGSLREPGGCLLNERRLQSCGKEPAN